MSQTLHNISITTIITNVVNNITADSARVFRTIPEITERQESRFWSYVDRRGAEECWPWKGYHSKPKYGKRIYGQIRFNGDTYIAHRVSYTLVIGSIPEGLTIDHVKDRCPMGGLCVNPYHLEPVTQEENNRRYNSTRTECQRGHAVEPYGGICRECYNEYHRHRRARIAAGLPAHDRPETDGRTSEAKAKRMRRSA